MPHCGHLPAVVTGRASWVRRLRPRVFECRRFGLGIVVVPCDQGFQSRESRILQAVGATQVIELEAEMGRTFGRRLFAGPDGQASGGQALKA